MKRIGILLGIHLLAGTSIAAPNLIVGADNNNLQNPLIQPQDSALSGGGRDQSQQNGDNLWGTGKDDLIIGGLGVDILVGGSGDDILIGGTEDFFPVNRDRAFGGPGNDSFLWAPGDGSDFFDGGDGDADVLFLGLIGEDVNGEQVFQVENDQNADPILIRSNGLPVIDVLNSPGFCEVVDKGEKKRQLKKLDLDHLVRFSIRGVRNSFEVGDQEDDNGLRITISLKNTEYLVCASREGGEVEVLDLRYTPAQKVDVSRLPLKAQKLLRSFDGDQQPVYAYQGKIHPSTYHNGNQGTQVKIFLNGNRGWFQNDWINGSFYNVKYNGNIATGYWKNQGKSGWFKFEFHSENSFNGSWGHGTMIGQNFGGKWSSK